MLPEHPCALELRSDDQLIEFLDHQKTARTDPVCIEHAIEELGSRKKARSVPILISFLDFAAPLSPEQESAQMMISSSHYGSRYKAVEALFRIGEPAVAQLMEVVRDRSVSPIRLKNAVRAYLDIRRENPNGALKRLVSAVAADWCPSLQHVEEKGLISFLEDHQGKANSVDSECVTSAMIQLGLLKSSPAVRVLTGYLDYEWPALAAPGDSSGQDPDHPLLYRRQRFPAVTALYLIGSPSLREILRLLEGGAASPVARAKAVETVMLFYAEYAPQGIPVIKSFAAGKGQGSAKHLHDAGSAAVQLCDIDHRAICASVLSVTGTAR